MCLSLYFGQTLHSHCSWWQPVDLPRPHGRTLVCKYCVGRSVWGGQGGSAPPTPGVQPPLPCPIISSLPQLPFFPYFFGVPRSKFRFFAPAPHTSHPHPLPIFRQKLPYPRPLTPGPPSPLSSPQVYFKKCIDLDRNIAGIKQHCINSPRPIYAFRHINKLGHHRFRLCLTDRLATNHNLNQCCLNCQLNLSEIWIKS